MDESCSKENIYVVRKPMVIEMKDFTSSCRKDNIEVPKDQLNCLICLDTVQSAVETDCCGLLLCEDCAEPIRSRPCPHCRRGHRLRYRANMAVRRIVAATMRTTDSNAVSDDTPRVYRCPSQNCRDAYVVHCRQLHLDNVELELAERRLDLDEVAPAPAEDSGFVLNELGRAARVGKNGKYYCGVWKDCTCCDEIGTISTNVSAECVVGRMSCRQNDCRKRSAHAYATKCRCSCCEQRCGPDDGCNCGACMHLDILSRGMSPGYLVNNDGVVSRQLYKDSRTNQIHERWNCLPDGNCRLTQRLMLVEGLKQARTLLVPCRGCETLQKQYTRGRYTRFKRS